MIGVSSLCGMGITVPLLFAHAIFGGRPVLFSGTQVGLLLATVGAAILGGVVLLGPRPPPDAEPGAGTGSPSRATVPPAHRTPCPTAAGDDPKEGRTS